MLRGLLQLTSPINIDILKRGLGGVSRFAHFTPPKPRFKMQVIGDVMCLEN